VQCLFQSEKHGFHRGRVAAAAQPPAAPAPPLRGRPRRGQTHPLPPAAAGMLGGQAAEGVQPRPSPPPDATKAGTRVLDVRQWIQTIPGNTFYFYSSLSPLTSNFCILREFYHLYLFFFYRIQFLKLNCNLLANFNQGFCIFSWFLKIVMESLYNKNNNN